jgi:hypothetical protein
VILLQVLHCFWLGYSHGLVMFIKHVLAPRVGRCPQVVIKNFTTIPFLKILY